MAALGLHPRDQVERRVDGAQGGGRQGGGVDQPGAAIDQIVFQRGGAGGIGAETAHAFREGAHHQAIGSRQPVRQPETVLAQHAGGVGLVEIEKGVEAIGQRHQRIEIGAVAIHREHRLGDDEAGTFARMPGQQVFQMAHVIVAEAHLLGPGRRHPMQQAGMVQLVGQHHRRLVP